MRNESEGKEPRKKKWQFEIKTWMGKLHEGVWVREAVATTLKRTFEHHTHGKGWTKKDPKIVKAVETELVYAHQGYRPKFDDEKSTRKSFFFRGARIWKK